MKTVIFAVAFVVFSLSAGYGVASVASTNKPVIQGDVVEHGGGCRKSSPAGQCCHKDHSTGIVHCH